VSSLYWLLLAIMLFGYVALTQVVSRLLRLHQEFGIADRQARVRSAAELAGHLRFSTANGAATSVRGR
jgi:hypothetical protein